MSAIEHGFVGVTNAPTSSSTTYADVTGAIISSGTLTVGKKYFLHITAQLTRTGGAAFTTALRLVHGSTEFPGCLEALTFPNADKYVCVGFPPIVWTAAAEDIKLQNLVDSASVRVDQIGMAFICLSDDMVENTDWFYNERTTDDSLTTTPLAGATVTFTPASAGQNWLVITGSQINSTNASLGHRSRIARSGEATETSPIADIYQGTTSGSLAAITQIQRVYTLGAASNTFTEESASLGSNAHTRLFSSIFVLRMNAFRNHAFAYTDDPGAFSATDFATQTQTLSITPDVEGPVLIVSWFGFDNNRATAYCKHRIQVDNADSPATQTSDALQFDGHNNSSARMPMPNQTMLSLTAAAHTVDQDNSCDSVTNTPGARQSLLWAVTMELPIVAGALQRAIFDDLNHTCYQFGDW